MTCRFISIDPLAAQYPFYTPYNYAGNKPINKIDIDGMQEGDKGGGGTAIASPTGSGNAPLATPTGATSMPRTDQVTPGTETSLQRTFRHAATDYAENLNEEHGGKYSEPADNLKVTAEQIGYEWVMGTGEPTRNFNENSTMGKEMLRTPEVTSALQTASTKAVYSNDSSGARVIRSAGAEAKLNYAASFLEDKSDNPTRALHGSFAGYVSVNKITHIDAKTTLVEMQVKISDELGALSGTRFPTIKIAGTTLVDGYRAENPDAIYPTNNPYGENGQFRTINMEYDLKVNFIITHQPLNGNTDSTPSFLLTPH